MRPGSFELAPEKYSAPRRKLFALLPSCPVPDQELPGCSVTQPHKANRCPASFELAPEKYSAPRQNLCALPPSGSDLYQESQGCSAPGPQRTSRRPASL